MKRRYPFQAEGDVAYPDVPQEPAQEPEAAPDQQQADQQAEPARRFGFQSEGDVPYPDAPGAKHPKAQAPTPKAQVPVPDRVTAADVGAAIKSAVEEVLAATP